MASNKPHDLVKPVCRNKKALHEFEILDRLEAGIVLLGSEVKSMRAGRANLLEAYVKFERGEAWMVGAHISPYPQANQQNHDPLRVRKLLLSRAEIRRYAAKVREKGLTVIALAVYFKGPHVKVEIGLGRGKKLHDKRDDIKERDERRDMERETRLR